MDEYVLPPQEWPAMPGRHRGFLAQALPATVALYTELRDRVAPATLVRRAEAERAVRDFLAERNNGRLPA